jgi:hypothetical protein
MLVLALALGGIPAALASADAFQSPLDEYKVTGYTYGYFEGRNIYHSGEDLKARHPQPVYAVADGVVVQSREKSDGWNKNPAQGYGNVLVVEHTLPDGGKMCSIYGHLSRLGGYKMLAKGTPVAKGDIVGYVGTNAENGKGGEHLHFGIKRGAYDGTYKGEVTGKKALDGFCKPFDYLHLVRAVDGIDVYRLDQDGEKSRVYSANAFNSWGWNWKDVRPVSQAELDSYADTPEAVLGFKDGTFIRVEGSPEISFIQDGRRHPFASWEAYLKKGGKSDSSNVLTVTEDEYEGLHPRGEAYK